MLIFALKIWFFGVMFLINHCESPWLGRSGGVRAGANNVQSLVGLSASLHPKVTVTPASMCHTAHKGP